MKKFTTILLLCAMLLSLAACGNEVGESTDTESTADTAAADDTETESETELTRENTPDDLPEKDFGGKNFTILAESGALGYLQVDELTGDSVDDAIYNRNQKVQDRFNAKCNFIDGSDYETMSATINNAVISGETLYDVTVNGSIQQGINVANGSYLPWNNVPYVDFTKPWWNQNVREALTFGSRSYLATGEITIVDNYATHVMIFDKKLATDFSIDDPYADVRNGKWTLDKFFRNASLATTDLDGDGAMGMDDRYGYAYWQDAVFSLLYATGNSFGSIIDGKPELTFYTDHTVDTWNKLMTFLSSGDTYATYDYADAYGWNIDGAFFNLLANHQILYGYSTNRSRITSPRLTPMVTPC